MNAARACAGRMRMPTTRARIAMRGGRGDGARTHGSTNMHAAGPRTTCWGGGPACAHIHGVRMHARGGAHAVGARTTRGEAESARGVASVSHATCALRAHAHAAARARNTGFFGSRI
eukprot:4076366-Pleurochrysis_carterae.AAC.1